MKKFLFPIYLFVIAAAPLAAAVIDDAVDLFNDGDTEAACELALAELQANPKSGDAGRLNLLVGRCKALRYDPEAASYLEKAAARGVADAYIELGKLDAAAYDFDAALDRYSKYAALKKKAGKPVDESAERFANGIREAASMLERVEKLVVIDSISVPKEDFFRRYRLPRSAGSLRGSDALPFAGKESLRTVVYTNEGDDFKMWAEPDSVGNLQLFESSRLTDGSWSEPLQTPEDLSGGGNAAYPFMMADGVTLYFASDGEGSIGGYDIFRSNRDSQTGEYMPPQNLGFPYNSPANDYMLAIDELTGAGWWATDRNADNPDELTIYVFVPSEFRSNYEPDLDNLPDLARISDYKATWGDQDYSDLLNEIAAIDPDRKEKKVDFLFPVGGGEVYTTLSDFSTPAARKMMQLYLAAFSELQSAEQELSDSRKAYSRKPSKASARGIATQEENITRLRQKVRKLRSDVFREEFTD